MTVYLVPDDPRYDAVGFSLTSKESYQATSEPTENPIEDGGIVNDHIVHRRPAFTCDVLVTNSPMSSTFYEGSTSIERPLSPIAIVGGAFGSTPVRARLAGIARKANRVQEMLERLEVLRLAGATMTVLWSAGRLDGYVLSTIGIERSENSIGKGVFSLELKPLEIVSTEAVKAPQPKEPRGSATKSKGAQPGIVQQVEELIGKKPGESILKSISRQIREG